MFRKIFMAVILLSIIGAGAYAGVALVDQFRSEPSEEPPPQESETTEEIVVDASSVEVTKTVKGVCDQVSRVSSLQGAWRCTQKNETVRDPCFATTEEEVVCLGRPWATSGTALSLREPLPSDLAGSSGRQEAPWGVGLETDTRCVFVIGTTFTVDDVRANYRCEDGGFAIGVPDESADLWTIEYAAGRDDETIEQVTVLVAWM